MSRAQGRIWAIAYGLVVLGLFAVLRDRESRGHDALAPLLETGGLIESLPFAILGFACLLALGLSLRCASTGRSAIGWLAFASFCFFLVGEEARWGQESVLGQPPLFAERIQDLHGSFQERWEDDFAALRLRVLLPLAGLITALSAALGVATLHRFGLRHPHGSPEADRPATRRAASFLVMGCVLFVAALLVDLLDASAAFSHGRVALRKWALEEALELLGSVAFLFAVAARWSGELGSPETAFAQSP